MIPDRGSRLVLAEVCLTAVTCTVVFGFTRVYSEGPWLIPLLSVAALAHGTGTIVRRLGLGVLVQVAVVALGTVLLMAWFQAPDTLRLFLPTADTLTAFGAAFDEALTLYPEAKAPTPPISGFILASMLGVAIVATMADIAAFRLDAEVQALIPPLTLFLFCAVLGSGVNQITTATAFIVSSLLFVLVLRTLTWRSTTTWLPGDDERGPTALVKLGGSLTAVAALAAILIAPSLPGADEEGVWSWRGGAGSGPRMIISPLVDIRSRLVNQSRDVAFVVESDEPSYWRMMALDTFDGESFRLSTNFRPVSRNVGGVSAGPLGRRIDQRIEIDALASPYLPAAFFPVEINTFGEPVRWDDRSSTLLLDRDNAARGFEYTVQSHITNYDPDRLRLASDRVTPVIQERYLALPELDPRVIELANEIVANHDTPYDRALALQNYLRDGFEYSITVQPGHSDSELVRFLFETRAGYCEQFSASFAALARVVGLPSRVAVGFTVGEQSFANRNLYTVRGEHAHAWPEVWFQGVGWVPFEPTPGRGDPQAEGHTGVVPQQAGDVDSSTTTTTTPGITTTTEFDPSTLDGMFPPDAGAGTGTSTQADSGLPQALLVVVALAALVAAWCLLVAALVGGSRHWRRRRAADDHGARILVAWDEVVGAARSLRLIPGPSETYREFTQRIATALRVPLEPMRLLAEQTGAARYAAVDPDHEAAALAVSRAEQAVAIIQGQRTNKQRVIDRIDMRRAFIRRGVTRSRRLATMTTRVAGLADTNR